MNRHERRRNEVIMTKPDVREAAQSVFAVAQEDRNMVALMLLDNSKLPFASVAYSREQWELVFGNYRQICEKNPLIIPAS